MNTKNLFWGFLFLTLGLLVFINNFTSINFNWLNLWEYWPLFLILAGVVLLIKQNIIKYIMVSLIAVILGAALFSTFKLGWDNFRNDLNFHINDEDKDLNVQLFDEDYSDSIKYASLNFEAGAGMFKIKDTTNKLLYAVTKGHSVNYSLSRLDEDTSTKINFSTTDDGISIFKRHDKNKVDLKLNPNPVWSLNLDLGAAAAEFDLSKYIVEDLNIDIGAASLKIILGQKSDSLRVNIDGGASSIEIMIPVNSGCEVNSDIVLSSRNFEGFNKIEDDLYMTDNFETSSNKIYMNIDAGVSSIKIKKYSGEDW